MCAKFYFILLIRTCKEEGKARMGVGECLNHHLVEPYNVLHEKEGKVHHYMTGFIHIRVKCYTSGGKWVQGQQYVLSWWKVTLICLKCWEVGEDIVDASDIHASLECMTALPLTEIQHFEYSNVIKIHNCSISTRDCQTYVHVHFRCRVLPILVFSKNKIWSAANQWLLKLHSNLQHHSKQPFWYFKM